MSHPIIIAPSLLSANILTLGHEIHLLEQAGADWLHLDIMDGHFVPNLTFGPALIRAIKKVTHLPIDVHLMVTNPSQWVPVFAEAGADGLTIHPEADVHCHRTLAMIRSLGKRAGIALNPGTPTLVIEPLMALMDMVLVMTVNPGFGGQSFLSDQLPKIAQVKRMIQTSGAPILLEVDGGITPTTAPLVLKTGADVLVAGHSILGVVGSEGEDRSTAYAQAIVALRGSAVRGGV